MTVTEQIGSSYSSRSQEALRLVRFLRIQPDDLLQRRLSPSNYLFLLSKLDELESLEMRLGKDRVIGFPADTIQVRLLEEILEKLT
jgi:hypothetical protein